MSLQQSSYTDECYDTQYPHGLLTIRRYPTAAPAAREIKNWKMRLADIVPGGLKHLVRLNKHAELGLCACMIVPIPRIQTHTYSLYMTASLMTILVRPSKTLKYNTWISLPA
jgi:hypothetical protein